VQYVNTFLTRYSDGSVQTLGRTFIVVFYKNHKQTLLLKVKASNPITGLDRPLGSQEVEAPRFLDSRHMKVVRKHSWYSFLLEGESTPGPWCDRNDYVNEKFQ
jgi:hypothetical protein